MDTQQRIFLGHASEDKKRVRDLHGQLKSKGFSPWLDAVDLIPGQNWRDEIPKAIKSAGVFLACLSKSSVAKQSYVQREFRYALAAYAERPPGSIYLIPVRLDDCEVPDIRLSELEINLRDLHWVDLFEPDGMDHLHQAIGHALSDTASSQTQSPSPATDRSTLAPEAPSTKAADGRWKNDTKAPLPAPSQPDTSSQKSASSLSPSADASRPAKEPNQTVRAAWIGAGAVIISGALASPWLIDFLSGPDDPPEPTTAVIAPAETDPASPAAREMSAPVEPAAQSSVDPGFWVDAYQPFESFRECDRGLCPEMILLPARTFLMGSPETEEGRYDNEGPQHEVTISKSFAIGASEVTFEEYDRFAEETGRDKPDTKWGRGKLPVINVSWNEASAFCGWLGEGYRLPTEAEWEYAARAGTTTPFSFGETITTDQVNYNGNNSNDPYGDGVKSLYRGKTVPVGSLPANAWGLHEMHGNAWEWVSDYWKRDYSAAAVTDPQGPPTGTERVLRGGSWLDVARSARVAGRHAYDPGGRSGFLGFRCARVQEGS